MAEAIDHQVELGLVLLLGRDVAGHVRATPQVTLVSLQQSLIQKSDQLIGIGVALTSVPTRKARYSPCPSQVNPGI